MSTIVEIENAALEWIDVTALIDALSDGTSDADQVIPEITVEFRRLPSDPDLYNPSLNKRRARIRVTEGGDATYYLMERPQGNITRSLDRKSIYGRGWAGVLDTLRPVSYEWMEDTRCSVICAQIAHQDVDGQGGITVGVSWQATHNETIPGGRYSVSAADRRTVIAEVAAKCGALVRSSLDGLSLEVYDNPARDGSEPVVRRYTEAKAPLNYELRQVEKIGNCVRVMGQVVEYVRATLATVDVTLVPGAIEADGSDVASAVARVYNSAGQPVQHTALVDEPIAAGSYEEIPVSGCYSVQGVWLNVGTQDNPVKGARITPDSVTASLITVPTQTTQLFIVSYTRAAVVSWSSADVMAEVDGEAASVTTDTEDDETIYQVTVDNPVGRVRGVYRATDSQRAGTNYYTGGSFVAGSNVITLGIAPGSAGTAVIVDYDIYEATPQVNISPATSLCDADGKATTTVGAGTTVGMVDIVASALGQEGSASLSLTGDAVGALEVTADPATIRAQVSTTATTEFSDEACETALDAAGQTYVAVDNLVTNVTGVTVADYGTYSAIKWTNNSATDDYRIYINAQLSAGLSASATYKGREVIDEAEQTSTIAASVLTSADEPAADGTAVKFELSGVTGGAELSATKQTTVDGLASVTLTAGKEAKFYVVVTAGSYRAKVQIVVTDEPLAAEQTESTTDGEVSTGYSNQADEGTEGAEKDDLAAGEYKRSDGQICHLVLKDWEDASGNMRGRRQAIDCDGEPIVGAEVVIDGAPAGYTDGEGFFSFTVSGTGSHDVMVDGIEGTLNVASAGDMLWTPGGDRWVEVCRDDPNAKEAA